MPLWGIWHLTRQAIMSLLFGKSFVARYDQGLKRRVREFLATQEAIFACQNLVAAWFVFLLFSLSLVIQPLNP